MSTSKNPSLEGHKLLMLFPATPDEELVKRLKAKHPSLQIQWHNPRSTNGVIPPELFTDATVMMIWIYLPTPEQAPKLRLVQLTSAGSNQCWDTPIFENPEVRFCTANGIHPPQITEWVFATYFSFQYQLPRHLEAQKRCFWDWEQTIGGRESEVEDSAGQRMGILGYGSIGRQCARAAKAFGMDVVVFTMRERSTPEARFDDSYVVPGTGDPEGLLPSRWFHGTTTESLNEFLAQDLDILVICLPQTPATIGMIGKQQFEILARKKTFVSNVARGPIVDTEALIQALEKGLIRGAALDVADPEPLPEDHPLWKAPNVTITPHMSYQSRNRTQRLLDLLELNLQRLSEGAPLVNLVDKKLGF